MKNNKKFVIEEKDIIIPVILGDEIGKEGQNSRVYLAQEKNIGREIVIKQIKRKNLNINYFEEAMYLYESKHPNIVEMSYAGESPCKEYVYLAMPYYKNGSLNNQINKGLTIRSLISYSLEFLSGLHSIHQKRLIHLDIKPDNILISDKNEAVLSDFGLVHKTNFFTKKGTANQNKGIYPPITPPENVINGHYQTSQYSDIYQVGITLFLLMNQKKLEDYLTDNHINTSNIHQYIASGNIYNEYSPHIPKNIVKIIKKSLEIKPQNRQGSVLDILNELSSISDNHNLDWEYRIKNNIEEWVNIPKKIKCSLTNKKEIVIFENNKKTYVGNDQKRLLDIFL